MGLSEEEIQKRLQTCSRHRAKHAAPGTPEHFWDIGMEDTLECEERGQFLYTNTHTNTLTNTESLMQHPQKVVEGDKTLKLTYKDKLIFLQIYIEYCICISPGYVNTKDPDEGKPRFRRKRQLNKIFKSKKEEEG